MGRNLIAVVSPTDTGGGIVHNVRRLGMLQVLGSPPRVRDLNKDEGRGVRATPLVFYLKSVSNSLTWGCYNVDVWMGEDG